MSVEHSNAEVWLVRHPETDWNRDRRYQGPSDRPLTERGLAQLAALAESFRDASVSTIVSTGLKRTDSVARAIAEHHPGATLRVDERWVEIDHGLWEGLTYSEATDRFGEGAAHGGETLRHLARRVKVAWSALLAGAQGPSIVVTHATPIQVMLCDLLGIPLKRYWQIAIELASVARVSVHPAGAIVQFTDRSPK